MHHYLFLFLTKSYIYYKTACMSRLACRDISANKEVFPAQYHSFSTPSQDADTIINSQCQTR